MTSYRHNNAKYGFMVPENGIEQSLHLWFCLKTNMSVIYPNIGGHLGNYVIRKCAPRFCFNMTSGGLQLYKNICLDPRYKNFNSFHLKPSNVVNTDNY